MPRNMTKLETVREFERREAEKIPASLRLGFHLTPLVGWMNDPNGFCWYNGCFHLFYQYHPYNTVWGPMHWGHAVTRDLLHWDYLPCALAPDTAADAAGCFSGSAVPLPDGRLLLLYTGVQPAGTDHKELQVQCVAEGNDRDYCKDPANPVLTAADLPEGFSAADFRDPKIWREGGTYYSVIACRHEKDQGSALLFESPDGHRWKFVSVLDRSRGELGRMWECPDFFHLDGAQVLLVSPQEMRATADSEFHAGEGTVALLGLYDPATHAFARQKVQAIDYGLDFYAPQTTLAPDGRRIMIAWMQSWATTHSAPRTRPWFGRMTLPRELHVRGGRLYQTPVREIETLWGAETRLTGVTVRDRATLPGIGGRSLDLTVVVDAAASPDCRRFTLRFAEAEGLFTEVRCDLDRGELAFDRSRCGSRRDIPHTRHIKAAPRDGRLTLRLILDKDCAELFVNDGERALSALVDTPLEAQGISFAADGGPVRLDVLQHVLG